MLLQLQFNASKYYSTNFIFSDFIPYTIDINASIQKLPHIIVGVFFAFVYYLTAWLVSNSVLVVVNLRRLNARKLIYIVAYGVFWYNSAPYLQNLSIQYIPFLESFAVISASFLWVLFGKDMIHA